MKGSIKIKETISVEIEPVKRLSLSLKKNGSIKAKLNSAESISGSINFLGDLHGNVNGENHISGVVRSGSYSVYDGDYEVTPKKLEQRLKTNDKFMVDDVKIKGIPYYETSNISGTTVYIGGN